MFRQVCDPYLQGAEKGLDIEGVFDDGGFAARI